MSVPTRPTWMSDLNEWGEIPNQSPAAHPKHDWNESTNRRHRRLVWALGIMGLLLAATLALSVVASLDQERAFSDVYLRWQLAEQEIAAKDQVITSLNAEVDLANEAWTQCSGLPLGPGA